MRKDLMLLVVALMGAAACEADREVFEETDADLAPPPAVEAARENPVNPTGEALGDGAITNDSLAGEPIESRDPVLQGTTTGGTGTAPR